MTYKKCPKCQETKPASAFYRSTKDGLSSQCRVCTRKRYDANKKRISDQKKTECRQNPVLESFKNSKSRAFKKNLEFSIELEDLEKIWTGDCACCGVIFDKEAISRKDRYSLDRVDNKKGYIKGNLAYVCGRCNVRKADSSIKDLEMIIRYINEHGHAD